MNNTINFSSERLLFREISMADLPLIHRLHSVPEVDEFNTLGIPKNQDETQKNIEPDINDQKNNPRSRFGWKILLKKDNTFIGMAGMFLTNDRFKMGEFYYKFFPEYWGKGFATETAKRIVELGFVSFNLHRIEAGAAKENKASIRVLEKAGMRYEGIRRKILPIRGEWKDGVHYAILEDEFLK